MLSDAMHSILLQRHCCDVHVPKELKRSIVAQWINAFKCCPQQSLAEILMRNPTPKDVGRKTAAHRTDSVW